MPMSQVKSRLHPMVSPACSSIGPAVTCCSQARPAGTEPVAIPVFALSASSGNFGAHLSGAEETPPKPTQAQGQAIFRLSEDGTELSYQIIVADIENATMSHIHLGAPGVAGPPVLWLYPSTQAPELIPGRSQGILGQGVATAADLVGESMTNVAAE